MTRTTEHAWRAVRLVLLQTSAGLAACATPPQPELWPAPDETAPAAPEAIELAPAAADDVRILRYPNPAATAAVLLVHGLGTNAAIWDLPTGEGLAPRLWSAGFEVFCLDWSAVTGEWSAVVEAITVAARRVQSQAPERPLYGVGHGLGGTALYGIAASGGVRLAGLAQLSAPLTFDGRSVASTALLHAPEYLDRERITWADLGGVFTFPSSAADGSFARTLLFTDPNAPEAENFYERADAGMSRELLKSLIPLAQSEVVAPGGLTAQLAEKPELPILVFLAPGDGLAPPWQCDPAVLGLRRDNVERHYLTRANGTDLEYNHLDLLLHPDAGGDVFATLVDWLEER